MRGQSNQRVEKEATTNEALAAVWGLLYGGVWWEIRDKIV